MTTTERVGPFIRPIPDELEAAILKDREAALARAVYRLVFEVQRIADEMQRMISIKRVAGGG